eukprot:CAMPEP_0179413128 /NCGR_PEP_ID=MMETSP0799-20121207/4907_1 /TAXON_ID=46947 /ORGANISM="Geminigera cryophila, Strain CCMP2564" /LENGTH=184 /DNA_ID=CAMNT_0021185527 /DNA_START=127 /DNA_END=678 /DNA_ORIENTATION=-
MIAVNSSFALAIPSIPLKQTISQYKDDADHSERLRNLDQELCDLEAERDKEVSSLSIASVKSEKPSVLDSDDEEDSNSMPSRIGGRVLHPTMADRPWTSATQGWGWDALQSDSDTASTRSTVRAVRAVGAVGQLGQLVSDTAPTRSSTQKDLSSTQKQFSCSASYATDARQAGETDRERERERE